MKHTRICYKLICALLCAAMLLPMTACGETKESQREIFAMDTVMTLTAYGNYREAGLDAAQSIIHSMDSILDPELDTSITYAINNAQGANVSITAQVDKMLSTAKDVYDKSGGSLDLSLYPVIKLWGFVDGHYYVPTDTEISQALSLRAFDKMALTSFPSSGSYAVSFPAGTQISFASVGKGCAAENAIDAMRQAGVTSGIVSLGGNVQTLGQKPNGDDWTIAIQDPNNTSSYLGVINVGETAVVTSGTYQRYFTSNGKTYHHLINPKTGYPVTNSLLSVTIICDDGTLADCLSTAMFVLGQTNALNYWRNYGGFEMIMVNSSNEIICTSGLIEEFTLANNSYTLKFTE